MFRRLFLTTALLALPAFAGAAVRYEYREVYSVQPIVSQQCYNQSAGYYERNPEYRSRTSPVVGAIIGGALGNQVGDGDGRRAATVAGAVLGYSMTRDAQERNRAQYPQDYRGNPSYACQHTTTGYQVTYRGGVRPVILPYNPGRNVRVRVEEFVEGEIP